MFAMFSQYYRNQFFPSCLRKAAGELVSCPVILRAVQNICLSCLETAYLLWSKQKIKHSPPNWKLKEEDILVAVL